MPVYDDDDDYDDDDRPSRRRSAHFPVIVMVAGIIWIVAGSLCLINVTVNLIQLGANQPAGGMNQPPGANQRGGANQQQLNQQAYQAGNYCGICIGGLIGLALVIGGYQTVSGKASDPIGYAIGSLILGSLQLACGIFVAVLGNGLQAANNLPAGVLLIVGVILVFVGLTMILAGIFALMGRTAYRDWRDENSPRARRRRRQRRRSEWEEEDDEDEDDDRDRTRRHLD